MRNLPGHWEELTGDRKGQFSCRLASGLRLIVRPKRQPPPAKPDGGLDWRAVAAMGDDWPDLPVMRRAALSCAPLNAHTEVRAQADHITQACGGQGAVRELCDLLLIASGRYASLLQEYTQ